MLTTERVGPAQQRAAVVCFGILVADVFLPPLARMPGAGELVATEDFLFQTGGCAANTALDLARLGVPSAAIGKVGPDPFGDLVRSGLAAQGVDVSGITAAEGSGTSKTVIFDIEGEDRRYVHTVGANAALRAEDLDNCQLAAGDVLYIGGYLVLPGVEQQALAHRLKALRQAGAHIVLDVCVPAGDAQVSIAQVEQLLPYVDLFVPNEDEARALTAEEEPSRQAHRLLDAGAAAVVITRGAAGALMAVEGKQVELRAPAMKVVDSSGAGDAFSAGFIYGLLRGWPPERSCQLASVVGASACTALGCTAGVFSVAEVETYLASASLNPA